MLTKVLVLDDSPERVESFKEAFTLYEDDLDVTYCMSYGAACKVISTDIDFDYMFLDHDLGEGPTGYDFSKHLLEAYYELGDKPVVVIHSSNIVGAENMGACLTHAGFIVERLAFAWGIPALKVMELYG